jgi:hypothetical protein
MNHHRTNTECTHAVETALQKLSAAIAAESGALRIQDRGDHGGSATQSICLLSRARVIDQVREDAHTLKARWLNLESGAEEPASPPPARSASSVPPNSKTLRQIPGVSIAETAQALGVTPAKVKEMLTSGHIKGYQRVSGTWKITRRDLLAFIRAGKNAG